MMTEKLVHRHNRCQRYCSHTRHRRTSTGMDKVRIKSVSPRTPGNAIVPSCWNVQISAKQEFLD